MKNILITGATGNIGSEVIRFLFESKTENKIIAGVRDIGKARLMFNGYPKLEYVSFDFDNPDTFDKALDNINTVFLLRPPHIADVEKYFRTLVIRMDQKSVSEIVFLSVQGAEKSKVIPHNKIEKLISEFNMNYIFLRPSYFMQNLTTILIKDIQLKGQIILPSGDAKFNWIDVENIGEVGAKLLEKFDAYKNQVIELTGNENENFHTVANLLTQAINTKIEFKDTNPFKFYKIKKEEGIPKGMIVVMILLHFLPRFQKEPKISDFYEKITGKKPTTLKEFMLREKSKFTLPYAK